MTFSFSFLDFFFFFIILIPFFFFFFKQNKKQKKKGSKLSKSVKPSIYTSSTSNNNNNNSSDIFNDLDSSYSPSSNYSKTDAPGDAKMKTAYDVSRQLMMDRLDESEKKILETATDSDIIVVEGLIFRL